MKKTFAFLLAGSLGLACGGTGLQSDGSGGAAGSGAGGQQNLGGSASGGAIGSGGGVGSGGAAGPGVGGSMAGGRGGSRAGGTVGTGGRGGANAGGTVAGGRGGTNAGGRATGGTSGAGGTICPPVACPAIGCLYGELPNPDPCGCPICAPPPDAGSSGDAAPDACPPVVCPAIRCAYGIVPSPDPCGCSTCAPPPDAGTETGKPPCVGLDECTCADTPGCSVMAEACYCPFPQCGAGACFCGGGRYIGCAPVELASCDAAKARVFALCPTLGGPTFDGLCAPSANTVCITECLNEVTACSDLFCTFCEGCDCASDRFSSCVAGCGSALSR